MVRTAFTRHDSVAGHGRVDGSLARRTASPVVVLRKRGIALVDLFTGMYAATSTLSALTDRSLPVFCNDRRSHYLGSGK